MNNKQNIITVFALILVLSTSVIGQAYFTGMGLSQVNIYDARSGGMGLSRTAIQQGAWSVTGNPALTSSNIGLDISTSMLATQVSETRSIAAIDQFNDVVTKNVYAANAHTHRRYAFATSYGFERFALAYAWVPVHDFSYSYLEEIRNSLSSSYYNRDPLAGYHTLEMEGQLYGHYMGLSSQLKNLSIGLSLVSYAANDISILKAVSVISEDDALASDTSYSDISTLSLDDAGIGYNIGLAYQLSSQLSLYYVLDKKGDISYESDGAIPFADSTKRYPEYLKLDSANVFTISTPAVHRMGVSFSPGQKHKTTASFEMELHKGQSITYSEAVQGLDTFNYKLEDFKVFHVGLEHWASPSLPIRMGFSYEESPVDKALSLTRYTAGGSLIVSHFQFDLSGNVASVGYEYPDIFPKVSEASSPGSESINETVLNLNLSISYFLNR